MSKLPTTLILILLLGIGACAPGADSAEASPTASATSLPAPEQITPTAAAIVATVNGEAIERARFDVNLALYQAAQSETGTLLATEDVQGAVLDSLIERLLLAQGAREAGFSIDVILDERLEALIEDAGGQATFEAWLAAQGYSSELFRTELALEIEAAHMRDLIAAGVPSSAEQVQARQILLTDAFQAERLLNQLESGTPFETVVQNNDPTRLGTLGWFPKGYLLQPEVEEAAFALQPGDYSQIVESELGYHLIEVLDRDPDRPLSPEALLQWQRQAIEDWLAQQRAQSELVVLLP